MRWHFAGHQLPAVGFPRKIVLAPLICDLGINAERLLHVEAGLSNPIQDNWKVKSVLQGIKRVKGASSGYKLPITPTHLLAIKQHLCLRNVQDRQLWAAILTAFFGLLRVSNIAGSADGHCVRRQDLASPRMDVS